MDAIVLKALTKDPDYRYQSADEMRADIEACLDGQPVAATAAMGAAGYGGYDGYNNDQPTTALRAADPGGQTSMLPPVNPDDGGYGYDDRPDRRRQKKSNTSTILLVVAGVLVLIGAILIGRVVFSENGGGGDKFDVPNMVGSTVKDAQRLADNAEVTLKIGSREPCEAQEKGQICSQTPTPDERMATGETVTVVVSTGAPKVEVPDVLEKSEDNARKALEDKGFTVNVETAESDKTPDTVISQDPKGGSEVEKESEITITVAKEKLLDLPAADPDLRRGGSPAPGHRIHQHPAAGRRLGSAEGHGRRPDAGRPEQAGQGRPDRPEGLQGTGAARAGHHPG